MSEIQFQLGVDDEFPALQSAWEYTLEALSETVNKPSYESWIKTARPVSLHEDLVVIGTTSRFAKHWLESKHSVFIREILESQLGHPVRVIFQLCEAQEAPIMTDTLPKKPKPKKTGDEEPLTQPLNTTYNFDRFVVGPSNRLAHACAVAISERPGSTYNPLFIYGGTGLGKTHLMHAVGLSLVEKHPAMRIAYVSGEAFTHNYITALREHKTAAFRKRCRNVDVWLVDDIQFLMGKERTEEEFFHTYNALYEMGKQVVLSSDRAPKDLQLDARLLSRFECGMIADVSSPDLETRMAILQSKAQRERFDLSDDVIMYIAQLITSNIRRLESALIQLHAYASLMKSPVTRDLASEVLGRTFGHEEPVIDAGRVIEAVAARFGVDPADIKGSCRRKDIVMPRQVAMFLTRELTDYSLPAIGRAIGGKDHSTVLHACRKLDEILRTDAGLKSILEEISRQIRGGKTC